MMHWDTDLWRAHLQTTFSFIFIVNFDKNKLVLRGNSEWFLTGNEKELRAIAWGADKSIQ